MPQLYEHLIVMLIIFIILLYSFYHLVCNSIGLIKNEQFIKYIIQYHLFCKIDGTL